MLIDTPLALMLICPPGARRGRSARDMAADAAKRTSRFSIGSTARLSAGKVSL